MNIEREVKRHLDALGLSFDEYVQLVKEKNPFLDADDDATAREFASGENASVGALIVISVVLSRPGYMVTIDALLGDVVTGFEAQALEHALKLGRFPVLASYVAAGVPRQQFDELKRISHRVENVFLLSMHQKTLAG